MLTLCSCCNLISKHPPIHTSNSTRKLSLSLLPQCLRSPMHARPPDGLILLAGVSSVLLCLQGTSRSPAYPKASQSFTVAPRLMPWPRLQGSKVRS